MVTTPTPLRMAGHPRSSATFASPGGLRALLVRLDNAGNGAWRTDQEAEALMRFTRDRYAALARKYGQDPDDAASAAFEAMLNPSTRTAEDPWAVVTRAVEITMIAGHRADGLLCSTNRARRAEYSVFHAAHRLPDHPLADPAAADPAAEDPPDDDDCEPWVIVQVAAALVALGWPSGTASRVVGHVCQRLLDIGDRQATYELLRQDHGPRARLELTHQDWIALLRLILGHPIRPGVVRLGILAHLLRGDTVADVLTNRHILATTVAAGRTPHVPVPDSIDGGFGE